MTLTVRGCRWIALILATALAGFALLVVVLAVAHLALSTLVTVTLSGARATASGFGAFVVLVGSG
jgi:hypothetical protein